MYTHIHVYMYTNINAYTQLPLVLPHTQSSPVTLYVQNNTLYSQLKGHQSNLHPVHFIFKEVTT